jgi:hypothetical protein
MGRQSPIDIHPKEMTVYEPQFNVEFKYEECQDPNLENILWTVRVRIIKFDINFYSCKELNLVESKSLT